MGGQTDKQLDRRVDRRMDGDYRKQVDTYICAYSFFMHSYIHYMCTHALMHSLSLSLSHTHTHTHTHLQYATVLIRMELKHTSKLNCLVSLG